MNIDEYQEKCKETAIYDRKWAIIYPALGIGGESGEVMEKCKKWLRDEDGKPMSENRKQELKKEIGDITWYISSLCTDLGFKFSEVLEENIKKLQSRKERGVLKGDGDNR